MMLSNIDGCQTPSRAISSMRRQLTAESESCLPFLAALEQSVTRLADFNCEAPLAGTIVKPEVAQYEYATSSWLKRRKVDWDKSRACWVEGRLRRDKFTSVAGVSGWGCGVR